MIWRLLCFSSWGFEDVLFKAILCDGDVAIASNLWYFILTELELVVSQMEGSQSDEYIDWKKKKKKMCR